MLCKKGALKNFTKFTGKHLCQSLLFTKDAGLRPATLLKMRPCHGSFTVNFVKFLRTPLLAASGFNYASKNSVWWRRPCFLFDKNLSYTESNYCKNKETLPDCFTGEFEREIKNEVISSKAEHLPIIIMDNIIDQICEKLVSKNKR